VLMVDVLDGDHDRLMMKLWLRKKFGFKKKVAAPLCYYFSFLFYSFGAKVMCRF
jgi:hypothetical protein